MNDKPQEKRKRGIKAVRERFGAVPKQCISVSRFYPADKSWTRSPVWFFNLSLARLEDGECEVVFLACEHETGEEFCLLKVPVSYLLETLSGLCVSQEERVLLHLSARNEDWLVDLRGKGRVPFAKFEV